MTTTERILCLAASFAFIIGFGMVTQSQTLINDSTISPGAKESFFINLGENIPEELRSFLNVPDGASTLSTDRYLQVCQSFASWARQVIKPEYVPNDEFIIAHLKLVPATTAGQKQDMAFLSCRRENMDYMIVQTGGMNGRVLFVTDRKTAADAVRNTGAKEVMSSAITNYLNISQEEQIPEIDVQEHGAVRILKTQTPATKRNKLTRAEGIVSDAQMALSVSKWFFSETAPAQEPPPDKWFEWEMGKSLQKPFPNP